MSAVPFDTLKFVEKLEAGGIPHAQAKATAEAFAEATAQELATKADLERLENRLTPRIAEIDSTPKLHNWMLGILIAGVGSLVLKAFFHG